MGIIHKAAMLLLAVFLCLFLFTSCSLTGTGSENLLYPRRSAEENAIYAILDENTDSDYTLVRARKGKNQNTVLYRDLDGDGINEITVSCLPGNTSQKYVKTLFLKSDGDKKPTLISSINGLSDTLDRIEFSDLDGDGRPEIIIGYGSLTDNYPSTLNILTYDEATSAYISAYITDYYDFMCIDLDGDGTEELLHINYSEISRSASALIIQYDEDSGAYRTLTGGATLAYTAECYRIQKGTTADRAAAVYITAKTSSLIKSTEVIIWDTQYMVPKNISLTNTVNVVSRDYLYYGNLLAQDIDSDGIIEFPVSSTIDEEKITQDIRDAVNSGTAEIPQYSYAWYSVNDGYPVYDFSCYVNADMNYYLRIDNPSYFSSTAVYKNSSGSLLFYRSTDPTARVLLFSIVPSPIPPQDDNDLLYRSNETGTYFIFIINDALTEEQKKTVITAEELRQSIYPTGIYTVSEN